jgi:ABC-type molybdate transport system permease subunit
VLAFARSLGEFGATITFVSNIPGETRTIPPASDPPPECGRPVPAGYQPPPAPAGWRAPSAETRSIHLPLVLPPVVVGYLLLIGLGRRGIIGEKLYDW